MNFPDAASNTSEGEARRIPEWGAGVDISGPEDRHGQFTPAATGMATLACQGYTWCNRYGHTSMSRLHLVQQVWSHLHAKVTPGAIGVATLPYQGYTWCNKYGHTFMPRLHLLQQAWPHLHAKVTPGATGVASLHLLQHSWPYWHPRFCVHLIR